MILKSIRLHPFAGIHDKNFEFEKELNLVMGPNEAGKSTLMHAIWNGLLTPTSFTARQLDQAMGRYFPAGGGDVIRVSLEMMDEDGRGIRIHKTWQRGNRNGSASLQLSNGAEIIDEEEVQKKIAEQLPVSPATMRTLLLAKQSELHHTIRRMEEESHVRKELGDLLRRNLMETDGVSVDRLRELLDNRYEEYFKRWDRQRDYPENNRGIANPFKVGVGEILEAYYEKEQIRRDLETAREFENRLDQVNGRLTELIDRWNEKRAAFEELEPLKQGIAQRKEHEQKLEMAELKKKQLLEINTRWPVLEDRIRNLEPLKKERSDKIANLRGELLSARNKQQAEQIETKIKRLKALKERVKKAHKELKEAHKIEPKEIAEVRELYQEISKLKSRIEGARLTLRIQSDKNQPVEFREAGKPEESMDARPGAAIEKRASGGFTLSAGGLNIEVFSGEGDLERVLTDVSVKEEELSEKFEEMGVENLRSAESLAVLYRDKKQQFALVKNQYTADVDDGDLETLENQLKELGVPVHVRPMHEINNDLIEAQTALKSHEKDARDAEVQLSKWAADYGSATDVVMELGKLLTQIGQLEEEMGELPGLPEGYPSADAFIQHVESLDRAIRQLEGEVHQMKLEKARLETDAPESSSEELEKMARESESAFQRKRKEGETLARVRDRVRNLLEEMDSDTYSGLTKSFTNWLQKMSGDRFEKVEMDGDLPSLFTTDDGRPLTFDLLSHGTKDTVALAWRLALTEFFLEGHKGVVILDDPMVDMDPARREQASKAIGKFAKTHQVVLLTCHPEHQQSFESAEVVQF